MMKYFGISLLIVALGITSGFPLLAQKKIPAEKQTSVTLYFPARVNEKDPVLLVYRTYGLFDELSETHSKLTKDGKCTFNISGLEHPIAIKNLCIDTRLKTEMFNKGYSLPEGELIEPGDSILITFRSLAGQIAINYSGKGAEKFKVKQQLYNRLTAFDNSELYVNAYHEAMDSVSGSLEKQLELCSLREKVLLDELNSSRAGLSADAYHFFKAEVLADIATQRQYLISNAFDSRVAPAQTWVKYKQRLLDEPFDDQIATMYSLSFNYINRIIAKSRIAIKIEDLIHGYKVPLKRQYEWLKLKYSGRMRDVVMAAFLTMERSTDNDSLIDSCRKDGLSVIGDIHLKGILAEKIAYFSKGARVYDFILPDTNGNMVSLKDFRGKVVILDVWFTGCGACATLADAMEKKVIPKFVNHDEVKFVSVSVDKHAATWKNSVRKGIYTSAESINLYTEGKAMEHPFIKNYKIQGCPKLMVIDKNGKMFSADPPRAEMYSEEMINVINAALKQ